MSDGGGSGDSGSRVRVLAVRASRWLHATVTGEEAESHDVLRATVVSLER
eukprot:CAMPEP_0197595994 /NCGR_PEP_ID=MMETSP1326-20131121/24103_1 /TAXON_ID=1155430 /ORGANISM="Genus nov. species nov., Strain RCC2288" /LENGTH=49 /DNA_ID= /DNA_START= /DNA_END= /DNA_ORIENTATION=